MPRTRSKRRTSKRRKKGTRRSSLVTKVYILYTGGTIGMLHNKAKGLIPIKGNLNRLVTNMNIQKKMKIKYYIDQTKTLIDSSNLQTGDMKAILEKLLANYYKYDSFIVIHGGLTKRITHHRHAC